MERREKATGLYFDKQTLKALRFTTAWKDVSMSEITREAVGDYIRKEAAKDGELRQVLQKIAPQLLEPLIEELTHLDELHP